MLLLALIRLTLNPGLMKARRGFTRVAGKEKLGGGQGGGHFRSRSPGPYIKTRKKRRLKPAFADIENREAIKTQRIVPI
jgi:hypothetical protein